MAIEALRDLVAKESMRATGTNAIRARPFLDRIVEVVRRSTNQQLTSAQVITELIELARGSGRGLGPAQAVRPAAAD